MEDDAFEKLPDVEISVTEDTGDRVCFLLTIHHVNGTDQRELEINGIAVEVLRAYQRLMHQPTLADALALRIRESLGMEDNQEDTDPWSKEFEWNPEPDDEF